MIIIERRGEVADLRCVDSYVLAHYWHVHEWRHFQIVCATRRYNAREFGRWLCDKNMDLKVEVRDTLKMAKSEASGNRVRLKLAPSAQKSDPVC